MAINTPAWLKNAHIYEVFMRNHSSEGTFDKVTEDLERIKALGVDVVWLTPIHPIGAEGRKGKDGSPYAIKDYRGIAKELGDEASLKRLIDKTHEYGMKIIIDVVYNHTSPDSVLAKEHPEYFLQDSEGNVTRKFDEWWDIADLIYKDNPGLWEYQIETLEIWSNLGIDGFRCDVASFVPVEFWNSARERLNKNKEVIWLAESVDSLFLKKIRDMGYTAHCDSELHSAFDLTYDYDGRIVLEGYFAGKRDLSDYIKFLFFQETMYPGHAIKMRFAENHDQPRFASIFTDKNKVKNWVTFFMLLPGAYLTYAGQEYFIDKTPSHFDIDVINWGNGDEEFYSFYKSAVHLSKKIKNRCDRFDIEEISKGIVKLTWSNKSEKYMAILNLEDKYGKVDPCVTHEGVELISGEKIKIDNDMKISKTPLIMNLLSPAK